jgi:hypothetical protein
MPETLADRPVPHGACATRRPALLVLLTATLPLLAAASLAACGRTHTRDAAAEPSRIELDTLGAGSISFEALTGTLSIHADLPPSEASPDDSVPPGWLFVDGQLVDRLPVRTEFRVAPGRYQVRAVLARAGDAGLSLWTVWSDQTVLAGETVDVDLGGALREWVDDGTRREAVSYARLAPAAHEPGTIVPDWTGEAYLAALDTLLPQRWAAFTASPEWKLIEELSARLAAWPPSRPRVWVALPDSLGGARELDSRQLRILAAWYGAALRDRFGFAVPEVSGYDEQGYPRPTTVSFQALYDLKQGIVNDQQAWVDTVFSRLRAVLDGAPRGDG